MSRAQRKRIEWVLRKRFRDEKGLRPGEIRMIVGFQGRLSRYKTLTDGEAAGFVAGMRL